MKKDYMYKYPSNVVYYSNYPYMDRNSNYNSNDERFAGGFIGPFIFGGITGGLVAPFFYGNGYGYNRPNVYYYQPGPYMPPYYYGRPY